MSAENKTIMLKQLGRHEGFRSKPYRCSQGYLTIGYGTNLDAGITEREAQLLMVGKIDSLWYELNDKFHDVWWRLSQPRQSVLMNMAYNLGINGLSKFKNMWAAIREGRDEDVVKEMLDSKWAEQVGKRAKELAYQWEQDRFIRDDEAIELFWTKK